VDEIKNLKKIDVKIDDVSFNDIALCQNYVFSNDEFNPSKIFFFCHLGAVPLPFD